MFIFREQLYILIINNMSIICKEMLGNIQCIVISSNDIRNEQKKLK